MTRPDSPYAKDVIQEQIQAPLLTTPSVVEGSPEATSTAEVVVWANREGTRPPPAHTWFPDSRRGGSTHGGEKSAADCSEPRLSEGRKNSDYTVLERAPVIHLGDGIAESSNPDCSVSKTKHVEKRGRTSFTAIGQAVLMLSYDGCTPESDLHYDEPNILRYEFVAVDECGLWLRTSSDYHTTNLLRVLPTYSADGRISYELEVTEPEECLAAWKVPEGHPLLQMEIAFLDGGPVLQAELLQTMGPYTHTVQGPCPAEY